MRLVRAGTVAGYDNYKTEVRANGSLVHTRTDSVSGEFSLIVESDPRVVFASFVGPLSDVVSENSQPVSGEAFKSITLPIPGDGHSITMTIIKLPKAATIDENGNVEHMTLREADGKVNDYCVGYCFPS